MTEALDYVFDDGPEVGYHLKHTKGVYLLGRCEDRAEAVRRKLALIARFHFDPAMIRIRPDNGGDEFLSPSRQGSGKLRGQRGVYREQTGEKAG